MSPKPLLLVLALAISPFPGAAQEAPAVPPAAATAAAPPAPLLDRPKVIEAAAEVTPEKYPDAELVLVSNHVRAEYQMDGSYVTLDDEYVKVLTEEGRRAAREKQVRYNAFYGGAQILAAEVIKPGGRVVSHDPATISKVQVDRAQMAMNIYDPNDKVLAAAVPDLETGDMVHFYVKRWESIPRMKGAFADVGLLEAPAPIRHVVYEFVGPKDKPLRSKALLGGPVGTVTADERIDGDKIRYAWTGRDIPRLFVEPQMPSLYTVGQRVLVSTLGDWKELSRWYWNVSKDHYEKVTPEMKARVSSLVAGANTDDERIKAIFKFASQEIRYMGITTENDAPGYEPHDVNVTFENRYGVCRDKAALLTVMLREAGIEAYPVLFNLGDKIDEAVPAVAFNHAITAVRGKDGKFSLMDCTDENAAELFSPALHNKSCIVATPEGESLITSPVAPAADNMALAKTTVTVAEDGGATGSTVINLLGINDGFFRGHLAQMKPDDVRRLFERVVKDTLPGGSLTRVKVEPENMLDTSQKLRFSFDWTVPSLLLTGGGAAQLELPYVGSALSLATHIISGGLQLEKRRFPLKTDLACGTREDLEIKLPPSLEKPLALPGYENTTNDDFSIVQEIRVEAGVLKASTDIRLHAPEISPTAYQTLKTAVGKQQANSRQQPVFARKSLTAPVPPATADIEVLSNRFALHMIDRTQWTTRQEVKQKVLTFAGKKDHAEIKLDYNPAWESVELEYARVTQTDGAVRKVQAAEINTLDAAWVAAAPRYPAAKTFVVSLPGVEIGSVIDYAVKRSFKDQPVFRNEFAFVSHDSVKEIEFSYDLPAALNPRLVCDFPAGNHLTDEANDGRRRLVFRWQDLNPRKKERNAPPAWIDAPDFILSASTWPEYAAAISKFVAPALEGQASVAAKAAELTAGKPSVLDKIIAVRDFVARQIRREGPAFTELPLAAAFSPAGVTLKDGYGHGADRAILLHALLKAAGIEADLALAAAEKSDPAIQQRGLEFPQNGFFKELVCRVKHPVSGEWVPLDQLSHYAPLGATGVDGRAGLTLDGHMFTWSAPRGIENREDAVMDLAFDNDGTATIIVTTRHAGTKHEAFVRQYSEMTPGERSRHFQELVSNVAQNATPAGDLFTDFNYPGTLRYTVKVERYGVKMAGGLYFDLPGVPQKLLPTDADYRERSLLCSGEALARTVWHISVPAGLTPVIQPEALDWRGPGNLGTVKFTSESNPNAGTAKLTYVMEVDLNPALIPTGNYRELLELNRRFNHPGARRVLLQPAGGLTTAAASR